MDYAAYWNGHARNVGHRTAVMTPLSDEEYRSLHLDVLRQLGPLKVTRMLDYGCGPALLLPIVREIWPNIDYHGADISGEMIDFCKDKWFNRFYWLPHNEKQLHNFANSLGFDFLTCHSVFTHLQLIDAVALLKELHRLLIPGGTASISILDEPLGDANFQGGLERVDFNRRFFEGMLIQAGFSIEKTYRRHQMYFGVRKV